ncbi:xanthine dehydrogenase family protein molybdopterin-binding subunit [Aureimonas jatrophae]|uniref:CO or xanthine dehydrogenase, Mo-binding subunit n=1 Tax=Aureimonas jatrophae TaxID=1166073 RepID=A0A1H0HUQ9_9HYPH|nr:molybdopterin cofactor-binding domain-containing protein [Aureimonas jatrophae]MBB3950786.1 CO/xanthine dehydrogenase Mo-binding subunit [Aureimonas jatrophae]SDO22869.1 CO or xanthine dehydrogenase, Mo-binding subunit [Aureimonas jatrophae]
MDTLSSPRLTRRGVLLGTGSLVLAFSMRDAFGQTTTSPGSETQNFQAVEEAAPDLPGSLKTNPDLESWIRIDADGRATVFTGKAELGQGIKTALLQVAAEELEMPFESLALIGPDTGRTPNEGFTAGSHSIQDSGTAIRHVAAQIRDILVAEAARRWGVPPETLRAEAGAVLAGDGRRIRYGELVSGQIIEGRASPNARLKPTAEFREMGRPRGRIDIPGKVTGGAAYVQDMRPDGMVHGRVVRPPSPRARLVSVDTAPVERMPGVLKVVRDGSFLGLLAEKEWQAIKAMWTLAALARWEEQESLPDASRLPEAILSLPFEDGLVAEGGRIDATPGLEPFELQITRPYQLHGSIGPSCAVAVLENGVTTVWTHTQGVFPDREAIAGMLRVAEDAVRCVHVEGSGCYGHNGADDAAADAALLAQALPGRPVRLQWMREQEHGWEPFSPGMVTRVRAGTDASGQILDWRYEVWSNTHNARPGGAGALLPAQHLAQPFQPTIPQVRITPEGNGDRNSNPLYDFPNRNVVWHFIEEMPLRVSALRGLGAYMNVFTIENAMDELAARAGADPVEYRLRHLADERARAVVERAAAMFGWQAGQKAPQHGGYGFAFARYKNLAAYCAVAMEVTVEPDTGRVRMRRASAAVDAGEVVNPDGVANQVQGGILQSASWTLYEAVSFDRTRVTSVDWSTYPILRFDALPEAIDVEIVPRPGTPFLGAGECSQGPGGAALANAVAHAIGRRVPDLPLTRERIRAAIRA